MVKRKWGQQDVIKVANKLDPAGFAETHASAQLLRPIADDTRPDIHTVDLRFSSLHAGVTEAKSLALNEADLKACLALVEETSGDDYRASAIGWSATRKAQEMNDEDMRFLLVRSRTPLQSNNDANDNHDDKYDTDEDGDKTIAAHDAPLQGFLSFMLTYEDGHPVIYIYEIHLKPDVRGAGLGRHLMRTVEAIGASVGVDKSMLTVFRRNASARRWYERLGYGVDEYSPQPKRLRGGRVKEADYVILSKTLAEPKKSANGTAE